MTRWKDLVRAKAGEPGSISFSLGHQAVLLTDLNSSTDRGTAEHAWQLASLVNIFTYVSNLARLAGLADPNTFLAL